MSALKPLQGHDDVRAALARSLRAGELPGSLLLHGPAGIGKQRLALWLGQLLLCEADGLEPCGRCRSCHLASQLEHPDLHWFFPLPRPKGAGSPEKLGEALEEARGERLAELRQDPLRPLLSTDPLGFYIQQMQTLRRVAASTPAMGRRKVFIVGDAELLVPQEASPDAANALLKLLEEPPHDTTIVLTAADPDALLPTIRSRMLPVRMRPLPGDDVERFLLEHAAIPAAEAARVARLAQGAIGRALAFLPADGKPGPMEKDRADARELLQAALAPRAAARVGAALRTAPAGARGHFSDVLDALALWVRDLAAVAAGAPALAVNSDAIAELEAIAARLPHAGAAAPAMLRLVDQARGLAYGNVNPQLILANLLRGMAEAVSSQAVATDG